MRPSPCNQALPARKPCTPPLRELDVDQNMAAKPPSPTGSPKAKGLDEKLFVRSGPSLRQAIEGVQCSPLSASAANQRQMSAGQNRPGDLRALCIRRPLLEGFTKQM